MPLTRPEEVRLGPARGSGGPAGEAGPPRVRGSLPGIGAPPAAGEGRGPGALGWAGELRRGEGERKGVEGDGF